MSDTPGVLLVEDEAKTAETVALYLRHAGYSVTVTHDGLDAQQRLATSTFDLVLLDRMLPGVDGLALARQVRAGSDVPIIMLTAMVDEGARLEGFAAGVDDYVTKPFSPRELLARCQAVLRRVKVERQRASGGVRVGVLSVETDGGPAWLGEQRLPLSPTESRLLLQLMRAAGRAVSREDLAERALRASGTAGVRTVDAHVKNLRRKLETAGVSCVETVFGVGYRLDAAAVRRA